MLENTDQNNSEYGHFLRSTFTEDPLTTFPCKVEPVFNQRLLTTTLTILIP